MSTTPASWSNVVDYGATPNDSGFDNTSSFQEAINAAATSGGTVFVPAGRWYFGSSGLSIPTGVRLAGTSNPLADSGGPPATSSGLAYEGTTANPFITITGTGAAVVDLAFWITNQSSCGGDPLSFSYTISGESVSSGPNLTNLYMPNTYNGIYVLARSVIEHIWMDAGGTGLTIENIYDTTYIRDIHIWPFNDGASGCTPPSTWDVYVSNTAYGITILNSTNIYISDLFVYGRLIGLYLNVDSLRRASYGAGTNISFDSCGHGIYVVGTTWAWSISNFGAVACGTSPLAYSLTAVTIGANSVKSANGTPPQINLQGGYVGGGNGSGYDKFQDGYLVNSSPVTGAEINSSGIFVN